jgi:hypothetical protein
LEADLFNGEEIVELDNDKLRLAKIFAWSLQAIALLVGFYTFFDPVPVSWAYLYYLVFPFLALAVYKIFNGYIGFRQKRTERRPPIGIAFVFPQLFMAFAIFMKYRMLGYNALIFPSALFAVIFTIIVLYKNRAFNLEKRDDRFRLLGVALLGLALGFGFSLLYNFSGVKAAPITCQATVDYKYIETGHGRYGNYTIYHVVVKQWQYSQMRNKMEVSRGIYDIIGPGQTIDIEVSHGKLNAPWYSVLPNLYLWPRNLSRPTWVNH